MLRTLTPPGSCPGRSRELRLVAECVLDVGLDAGAANALFTAGRILLLPARGRLGVGQDHADLASAGRCRSARAGAAGVEAAGAAELRRAGSRAGGGGGVDDAGLGVDFLLLQPAMPSPATAATAMSLIAVLFMHDPLLRPGAGPGCPRPIVLRTNQLLWRTTYDRRLRQRRGNRRILTFGMDLLHRVTT